MQTISRDTPIRAWHFLADDHRMRDGVTAPPDGEWFVYPGKPILCEQGLHASVDVFDALQYAPGGVLCLVDCAGTVSKGNDKLVCTERRIVVRMEAEPLLRYFARQQALSVIDKWQTNPAGEVLDWLMGDAAESAAESAARSAAESAAWSAAESAAESAAWLAAESAAESAAWSAARSAAWSAAWSAARSAAWLAARSAAESAAWLAAESAAWSAVRQEFNALVNEAFADWI